MATYTYAKLKAEFNTRNRNSDNFVFTDTEVDNSLKGEINFNPMVFDILEDDSIITTDSTYSYEPDQNFENITDVKWDYFGNGSEIDYPYDWRFNNSVWKTGLNGQAVPSGKNIILFGKVKFVDTDSIPSFLVDYIMHGAQARGIQMLIADKSGRFLRNDTTMAELQAALQTHKSAQQELERKLPNRAYVRV